MSADRKINRFPKGPGYEYWSRRPFNKNGGCPSPSGGKHHKKRTHKAERRLPKEDFDEAWLFFVKDIDTKQGQNYWDWVSDIDNIEAVASGDWYFYLCDKLNLPELPEYKWHRIPESIYEI